MSNVIDLEQARIERMDDRWDISKYFALIGTQAVQGQGGGKDDKGHGWPNNKGVA